MPPDKLYEICDYPSEERLDSPFAYKIDVNEGSARTTHYTPFRLSAETGSCSDSVDSPTDDKSRTRESAGGESSSSGKLEGDPDDARL